MLVQPPIRDGLNIYTQEFDASGMKLNFSVLRLRTAETFVLHDAQRETAILLLQGQLRLHWQDSDGNGIFQELRRPNCFDYQPCCLHVPKNTQVILKGLDDERREPCEESEPSDAVSEIVLQQATNSQTFAPKFYRPQDLKVQVFGKGQWHGTATRSVCTIFDYDSAPYSQVVLGEAINHPGRWSSYPPHSHRQPEIYYYRFNYPQGFGSIHIGDNAYTVRDRSAALISGGLDHPQTAAPGYAMYFCWMIRHLPGDPWRERKMNPAHNWLNELGAVVWPDKN